MNHCPNNAKSPYGHHQCPCGTLPKMGQPCCHHQCSCGKLLKNGQPSCHYHCPCGKLTETGHPVCHPRQQRQSKETGHPVCYPCQQRRITTAAAREHTVVATNGQVVATVDVLNHPKTGRRKRGSRSSCSRPPRTNWT